MKAQGYCLYATSEGVIPIAPHIYFTQFLDERMEAHRQKGMSMGLDLLKLCSELWVFGNRVSSGMSAEIDFADKLGIPIQYYTDRCERREKSS